MNANKYHNQSEEVVHAKSGAFDTLITNCIAVNGSKYKPSHWRGDMFEVETTDGVYITEDDFFSAIVGCSVSVKTKDRHNGWWRFYLHKTSNLRYPIEYALKSAPNKTTYVYKLTFGKEIYIGFTSKPVEKRIDEHKAKAFDKANPGIHPIHKEIRRWGGYFSWEVIAECNNEIQGLLEEIRFIEREGTLNESDGGQGANFDVVPIRENEETIYMVYDRNGLLVRK